MGSSRQQKDIFENKDFVKRDKGGEIHAEGTVVGASLWRDSKLEATLIILYLLIYKSLDHTRAVIPEAPDLSFYSNPSQVSTDLIS